jgi:alkyl sulfatase BDS1-like metallo-beta-lactamase superfamily hydrolase
MRNANLPFAVICAGLILALQGTATAQIRSSQPRFLQVNDRVYVATGYALANVIYVLTDTSLVVIDTSESPTVARETFAEMRKITDKPVRYLIYTHFHGDHCNGARAFADQKPQIIAQQLHRDEMAKYQILPMYNRRLNGLQFGFSLPPERRAIALAADTERGVVGYLEPTMTFDDQLRFQEGGLTFELHHAPGETPDQLFVWIPEIKTLMPGDLYYNSFPMIASPMKPDRPITSWAASLDKMRRLKPDYLVPSHSEPICGAEAVADVLKNYAEAIKYINRETIKGLNSGLTLDQMRRTIKLPSELADKPYLRPLYGRIEWAINGAYRNYTGWYDFNPTHLNPASPNDVHRAIVRAVGGVAPLLAEAAQAGKQANWQMVLELTDIVLTVEPENREAHAARAEALDKLADEATSSVECNIYRAAALEHQKKAAPRTTAKK